MLLGAAAADRKLRDIPVLLLTAHSYDVAEIHGMSAVFPNPIDGVSLLEREVVTQRPRRPVLTRRNSRAPRRGSSRLTQVRSAEAVRSRSRANKASAVRLVLDEGKTIPQASCFRSR
jgi:hypothetical protein